MLKAFEIGAIAGCHQLWMEINWVLTKKYRLPEALVGEDLSFYRLHCIEVPITGEVRGCKDPDDDFILECASRTGAKAMVSNDLKHLVSLGASECIPTLTPTEFLLLKDFN